MTSILNYLDLLLAIRAHILYLRLDKVSWSSWVAPGTSTCWVLDFYYLTLRFSWFSDLLFPASDATRIRLGWTNSMSLCFAFRSLRKPKQLFVSFQFKEELAFFVSRFELLMFRGWFEI
uniref:Uncharacterized protein n=1 Tax=Morchella brunnea TaxID=1174671 RepID=A0A8K1MHA2_9PEZI|nr:hypothetical protein LK370_mgp266 [Morchella brunnea]UBU98476.1 hypothetical protein [Morchella brunnea]